MSPRPAPGPAAPTLTAWLARWHLGHFLQDYTPVGRGFNSSFGFLGGYETYDTHMLWNGRWNLTREQSGVLNGGYYGPYITDLYESDHAATDAAYNGTCTSAGVCTCSDAGTPPSRIHYLYSARTAWKTIKVDRVLRCRMVLYGTGHAGGGDNTCRYSSYLYTQKSKQLISSFPLGTPQFW